MKGVKLRMSKINTFKKLWSTNKRFIPTAIYNNLVLCGVTNILPDKLFLKLTYWINFGKKLDLNNPKLFNEKIQWLKLYDRKSEYIDMVDKIKVKNIVADLLGEEYIIPTLGVWDSFDDIDFDLLPNQFVLKCNHDSGSVIICRDKSLFDIQKARRKLNKNLKKNMFYWGREWPYKNVEHKIFAEKYMEDGNNGLRDYKYFVFNGEAKFIYISEGLEDHNNAKISFFDLKGNLLPFKRLDFRSFDNNIDNLPGDFSKMEELSTKLAASINSSFVRIDLYNINGKIFFSEITFSPCSGFMSFSPPEWDSTIGKWLKLPKEKELIIK